MMRTFFQQQNYRYLKLSTCSVYVWIIRHNISGVIVVASLLLPCFVDALRMKPVRSNLVGLPVSSESHSDDFKELFCTPDNLEEFGTCSWSTSAGKKCKWERNETGTCKDDPRLERTGTPPLTDCRIRIDAKNVRDFDAGEWTCLIHTTGYPFSSINFTVHPIERATDVIIHQPNEASDPIVHGVEGSTARVKCKFRTKSPGCEVGVSVNENLVANETVHHDVAAVIGEFNEFEQEFEIELKADFCDHDLLCEVMELDFSGDRLYHRGTRSQRGIPVDVAFAPRHVKTDYMFRDKCVQLYFRANPKPKNFTLHLSDTGETFHFHDEKRIEEGSPLRWALQNRSNHVYKLNLWIREEEDEFNRTGWISVINDVDTHSVFFRFPKQPPTTEEPSTTTVFSKTDFQSFMSNEEMINFQIAKDKSADKEATASRISIALLALILAVLVALIVKSNWRWLNSKFIPIRSKRRHNDSTSSEDYLLHTSSTNVHRININI